MKRFLPLLLLLGAFACSTVRQLPSTDSTKVEVRTETVTVHDTAYVELPVIIEKVATLDTTSTLENKFARSEASVSAGILSHTLETKPVQLPVQFLPRAPCGIIEDSDQPFGEAQEPGVGHADERGFGIGAGNLVTEQVFGQHQPFPPPW